MLAAALVGALLYPFTLCARHGCSAAAVAESMHLSFPMLMNPMPDLARQIKELQSQ